MKKSILLIGILFLSIHSYNLYAQQTSRPNIIVFLVDDMGWQDCSLPFWTSVTPLNKRYHTPNMERLAKEGMKFTNAYAAPVCTPSRCSMISGMNAAHHGITNWTSPAKNNNTDAADDQFGAADWNINGLSPVAGIAKTAYATPLPELLKQSGYFTIHTGKAHWASYGTPGSSPYNMGFIVNISGHSAGHPQSYLSEEHYGNMPGKAAAQAVPDLEEYYDTGTFLTEALTLEAKKALEYPVKQKQPFFLLMAHYAVHVPIMADPRFMQKYLDSGSDSTEAGYAALLEGMDKSLGDIMDFLKAKEIEKNTIIIFMSDNGGLSLAPPRGGVAHTQNLPLRAGKGSVYEGGIREPMIVKSQGITQPASTASQYIIIEDFFPTILEMAGVRNYKTLQQVDGRSFVPVLKNAAYTDSSRLLIWHYPNKWQQQGGPGINYYSAARKGEWKLVYSLRTDRGELYNLHNDIGETTDLATQYPEKLKELESLLGKQLQAWKAPMPVDKASNSPVAFPGDK